MKGPREIDVLFINPRDLSVPQPYVKTCTAAALLIENGIRCSIIEPAASNISHNELISIIEKSNPAVVCVSVFPSTLPDAYQTINLLRASFKDIIIIVEGYMINADTEAVVKLNADYGVHGDIEYCLLNVITQLLRNEPVNFELEGLIINTQNGLKVNPKAFIKDIDALPKPAYNLLPIGKYYSASTNKKNMVIFTDRGCPYDCSFCANASQKSYRYLSIENIICQLKYLVFELKVEFIEFMDLTFTINRKRTIQLCQAIIENKIEFEWACETRADLLDRELLEYMKKAGCYKITIGVESGNEKIRISTGKKISNQKFVEIFDLCEEVGIKTMANFIIGHPNETVKDVIKTIDFSLELEPFNILYTKMTPLPDVEIYFNLVKEGVVDKDVWYQYMVNEIPFPVYYPSTLGRFKMELLYRFAYIIFYLRPISFIKYYKLFNDIRFFYFSIKVFLRFVFGKTIYK